MLLLNFRVDIFRELAVADIILSHPAPKLRKRRFRIAPSRLRIRFRLREIIRIIVIPLQAGTVIFLKFALTPILRPMRSDAAVRDERAVDESDPVFLDTELS